MVIAWLAVQVLDALAINLLQGTPALLLSALWSTREHT